MTNDKILDLLSQAGLEVSKVKTLPSTTPSQDIAEQLQIEQGLNLQSTEKSKDFLSRKTSAKAKFNNQIVDITFTYKRVKGIDVGDTENADKNRYAIYIDKKFDTGVYFTQLGAVKQFEYLLKYNAELLTDDNYSAFHIGQDWKLPTQFQTELGRNKCLTWTSNQGVPVIVPTITMCQNFDNSNELGGTPFSRPNYRIQKQSLMTQVQVGLVHNVNIPVLAPSRWSVISQDIHNNKSPQVTTDEASFISWYSQLVDKASK
tara:strand:- start:3732 stop:4511 length:780 start_codon:yes stop_codon:yes gene_type:complete